MATTLYFTNATATTGRELWRAEPGQAPAMVSDVNPGAATNLLLLRSYGSRYILQRFGTADLYEFNNGTLTAIPGPAVGSLFDFNGTVFGTSHNGTANTLQFAAVGASVSLLGSPAGGFDFVGNQFSVFGPKAYFWAGAPNAIFSEFWSVDASGTITKVTGAPAGFGEVLNYDGFHILGSNAYFQAFSTATGSEWFKMSNTGAITVAADIAPGAATSGSDIPVEFGGRLFFAAGSATTGREIYRINADGSFGVVQDISPGAASSSTTLWYENKVFNGELFFPLVPSGASEQLWKIKADGTAALVAGPSAGTNFRTDINSFVVHGNELYFRAFTAEAGIELWKVNAAGAVSLAKDVIAGAVSSYAEPVISYNGALYFKYITSANGEEVGRLNANGTVELFDINPGVDGSEAFRFIVADNKLYFTATDAARGNELRVFDTTGALTSFDLNPGAASGAPSELQLIDSGTNTAPTNITLSNASVREFAATGTDVGVLSATDAQGGAMTYALLNSAGGRFKITGNVLEVDNGLLSDFEQDSTHSVQVRVTDSGGLTFTKTLNLTLTDINPEVITGTAAAETFFGGAGADTLKGGGGNDALRGNGGADRLEGGTGNDKYFTDGLDTIVEAAFSAGGGIDTLYSSVSITLPANVEILRLEGSAAINGTGTGAPESIIGNSGINTLTGGGGADTLNGKSGNDIIIGGAGRDTLIGEAGNDRFKFNATADSQVGSSNRDFINGFVRGEDKIDLSAIDANPFTANDQVFTFKGTAAFGTNGAASAGQLRISFSSANFVILDADVQGDGIADMQIVVSGVSTLGTSDFVL